MVGGRETGRDREGEGERERAQERQIERGTKRERFLEQR
jgi:hypothetical protein